MSRSPSDIKVTPLDLWPGVVQLWAAVTTKNTWNSNGLTRKETVKPSLLDSITKNKIVWVNVSLNRYQCRRSIAYLRVAMENEEWAYTKTQNNKTKRPKRNDRNHQNENTETTETTKTKPPKRAEPPKRPKRNERNHRNDQNETTQTKSPKPAKPSKRAKGNPVTPNRRLYRPCRTEYYLLFFRWNLHFTKHQERQSTFASTLTSVLSLGRLSGHLQTRAQRSKNFEL